MINRQVVLDSERRQESTSNDVEDTNAESLKFPLSLLRMMGLFTMKETSRKIMFVRALMLVLLFFLMSTAFVQLLMFKGNVHDIVANMQAASAFGHFMGKALVITFKDRKLYDLIRDVSRFWNIDTCKGNRKLRLKQFIMNIVRLQKLFSVSMVSSCLMFVLFPLFGKDLPIGQWTLKSYNYFYKMVLVSQMIIFVPAGIFLTAFDCIFLAFCVEIVVQFRVLGVCFKELEVKDVAVLNDDTFQKRQYGVMKSCVQHHIFLLKFLKDLQDFYSPAIMIECINITPAICGEMYAMFESKDIGLQLQHAIICFSCTLQLAFYCIFADYATSEGLLVAEAIFNSNWHTNPMLKKSLPFIIQKSQKPIIFTAGGLFEISSRTVLNVLKVSWSLCTVMRVIKQK